MGVVGPHRQRVELCYFTFKMDGIDEILGRIDIMNHDPFGVSPMAIVQKGGLGNLIYSDAIVSINSS